MQQKKSLLIPKEAKLRWSSLLINNPLKNILLISPLLKRLYNLHIGSYLYIAIDLNYSLFFKNIIAVIPLPEKEPKQDTSLLSNNTNVVVWQLPLKIL